MTAIYNPRQKRARDVRSRKTAGMSWAKIGALALGLTFGLPTASRAHAADSNGPVPVPGSPFQRYQLVDRLHRTVTYYVSHPKAPAPVLLMIQGSGCSMVLHSDGKQTSSSMYNLLPLAAEGRFTVVAVEKPFADPKSTQGDAETCSAGFKADFTAETWLVALEDSLNKARRLPWVDARRTLVFGFSEGAVMASLLAGHDRHVTDVIAIGGSGTTQLYDFIVSAYQRCFDRKSCIADVERQVRAINAAPDSATDMAWGHPYKRWSSFFRVDPGGELLRSTARVYLAFGTDDRSVPALSQEITVAKLLGAGRDVTVRRVADAGHELLSHGSSDFDKLGDEYRLALNWFWARPAKLPQ